MKFGSKTGKHPIEVPSGGVYFATYEWLQIALAPNRIDEKSLNPFRTLLAGGLAGIANWIIAIPPDVLKSRLQTGSCVLIFKTESIA